jgi:AcrR family transcriptional regulator
VDAGEVKPVAPRGRPRDPEREQRVLVAAIEEYSARGWAGLTMDGVAKRAGVGKSTIYLRWTNKEDLLAAAVQNMSGVMVPLDTGSLRGDFTRLAQTLIDNYWTPIGWGMYRILIDVAGSGEQVSQFAELVNGMHRRSALAILERGVQRGELQPDVPAQLVINALYGTLVIYRMMAPWDEVEGVAPVPEELVSQVVDFVMAGLAPYVIGAEGA